MVAAAVNITCLILTSLVLSLSSLFMARIMGAGMGMITGITQGTGTKDSGKGSRYIEGGEF